MDGPGAAGLTLVLSGGDRPAVDMPPAGGMLRIGRHDHNDVVLDDRTVSGEHAVIIRDGHALAIRDLGSRNGTRINGSPVTGCALFEGDRIDIGIYRLTVARTDAFRGKDPAASLDATARAGGSAAALDEADAARCALLEYLNGSQAGQSRRLEQRVARIGDGHADAVIARRRSGHVLARLDDQVVPVVNGRPVGPGACPLADGDTIELGDLAIRFHLPG